MKYKNILDGWQESISYTEIRGISEAIKTVTIFRRQSSGWLKRSSLATLMAKRRSVLRKDKDMSLLRPTSRHCKSSVWCGSFGLWSVSKRFTWAFQKRVHFVCMKRVQNVRFQSER
nr:MAG TPA: hypothetical protein [Caudoviricetes sp.]